MAASSLNYFTCTLGQAVIWKRKSNQYHKSVETVPELIERQASAHPRSLALGFADSPFKESHYGSPLLTFQQLHNLSITAAETLGGVLSNESKTALGTEADSKRCTVALLCTSSVDFIITYLGLVRLGCVILLLAPQLEPPAIEHLCDTCAVKVIFVDKLQSPRIAQIRAGITIKSIPDYYHINPSAIIQNIKTRNLKSCDPVHIFHTSGTSSGLPKPIVQTHWAAVGALPYFTDTAHAATFSTTPLYHGGLADCFRSWTSGSMIWFFPEGVRPITSANIIKAVISTREIDGVQVRYFTGVPYVLQLLGDEEPGVHLLQSMDIVGVGGAALAPIVGDNLTKAGVRLISRMGSAECGFLMSSDRDFTTDTEWEYLRPVQDSELLSFEPRNHGLFELIAKPAWPLKTKVNRNDGSYATSDLFQPHPTLPNAWRYHSRADAQITLASGKKFDPSPIEASILASSKILDDVFVFGTGKPYVGALLFPHINDELNNEIINSIWPKIDMINQKSQSHARLSRQSLVVVRVAAGQPPLEKSSKGTIMRQHAQDKYRDIIESVYINELPLDQSDQIPDDKVLTAMEASFAQVLGREIDPDEDVFRQGVDSIASIQIRNLIQSSMIRAKSHVLPPNIIYEQGTISALAAHVINIRQGMTCTVGESTMPITEGVNSKLVTELIAKYSIFQFHVSSLAPKCTETILLTGATGSLGTHILHLLRKDPNIHRIYCLVRAQTVTMAQDRVSKSLSGKGLPGLGEAIGVSQTRDKVVCLPWDISDSKFGLDNEHIEMLITECTTCIHSAWPVNFSLKLESFEDHLFGLHNLLAFVISARANFAFISSTAAVDNSHNLPVPEIVSSDLLDASPLGYSQSKWAAEKICTAAHDACSAKYLGSELKSPKISVLRVGQLCGNVLGIWNANEAYPLMLSTSKFTGCLPNFGAEALNWLPVDQAAQAVLEITLNMSQSARNAYSLVNQSPPPLYHILNPHTTPSWHQMMQWLVDEDDITSLQVVSPAEWVDRLEICLRKRNAKHPAERLLAFWKTAFHANKGSEAENMKNDTDDIKGLGNGSKFEVTWAVRESHTLANMKPLDRNQVLRMWRWINRELIGV